MAFERHSLIVIALVCRAQGSGLRLDLNLLMETDATPSDTSSETASSLGYSESGPPSGSSSMASLKPHLSSRCCSGNRGWGQWDLRDDVGESAVLTVPHRSVDHTTPLPNGNGFSPLRLPGSQARSVAAPPALPRRLHPAYPGVPRDCGADLGTGPTGTHITSAVVTGRILRLIDSKGGVFRN